MTPATEPTAAPRPRRRWRWLWRLCLVLVAARLGLGLALEPLLRLGAAAAGLQLEVRTASLSLSGLALRAHDLVLRDPAAAADAPALLTVQDLLVDASLRQLLHGEFVLVDVAASGAHATLREDGFGGLVLPAAWRPAPVSAAAIAPPAPPATGPAAPWHFDLPLHVVSARLHDVRLTVLPPHGAAPRLDTVLDLDARDVGHRERAGVTTVSLRDAPGVERCELRLDHQLRQDQAALTLALAVRGLRPAVFALPDELAAAFADTPQLDLTVAATLTASTEPGAAWPDVQARLQVAGQSLGAPRIAARLELGPSRVDGGALRLPFTAELSLDRALGGLRLADGEFTWQDDGGSLRGQLTATELTAARFSPLLAAAGIHVPPAGLQLQAGFEATFGAPLGVTLRDVVVAGADANDRLTLPLLRLDDVQGRDGGTTVGAITVQGPQLQLRRTASGALACAGITFTPVATASPTTAKAPPFAWPRLSLGTVRWTDASLEFVDASQQPAATLAIAGLTLRGDGITLGTDAPPGRLELQLQLPGVAEDVQVRGRILPGVACTEFELDGALQGITLAQLKPWLDQAGLRSEWRAGRLQFAAAVTATTAPEALALDARLANVRLTDGDRVWLSLRGLRGEGMRFGPDQRQLGTWEVLQPFAAVDRIGDGWRVCGLATLPTAPAAVATAPAPPAAANNDAAAAGSPPPPDVLPSPPAPALRHGTFTLLGGSVRLDPGDGGPTYEIGVEATVGGNSAAGDVPLHGELSVPGTVRRLTADLAWAPTAPLPLVARVACDGLVGAGLQRLLPPALQCTMVDGSLRFSLVAKWPSPERPDLVVGLDRLQLQDRGAELAAIDTLELSLATATLDRVHVRTAKLLGVRGLVTLAEDGIHVGGLRLAPAAAEPPLPPPATSAAPDPAAPAAPWRLPVVAVDSLQLALDRLVVRDRRTTEGEPLVLTGTVTGQPWAPQLDTPDAANWQLVASGTALPLLQEWRADLDLAPFDLAPTATIGLHLRGIDTTALPRVWPPLANQIAGVATAAEFDAVLTTRLDLKRRDPRRFDFGRPFGGEVRIEHARLHEPSTGRTFFQAATLDALARAVDPRTGDVLLRAVELDAPELQAVQTDAGLELLGVRLLPPPAAAAGAATAAAAAAAAPTAAAAPELRLDRLRVHGLALRYDDLRTTPATVLPVLDGEFEIEHFTTRPRGTTRPLSFRGSVRGGEVPLEQRILRSSVVAGLLQSAAGAIVGRDDSHAIELRPCFDEIRLQGELTQREPSRGELELTISAFELPALRGLGKRGGVDIADGILDQRLRLALRGDDGVLVRSSSVFTWLSLSEPPGGPISTYLRLPAPLDTVLFVLRNDADEHRIPLQLEVRGPGMRGSDVLDLVVKTLANVLGDAARGALGRTTSALSGALGLGAASGGPRPLVAELACAAGDAPQCAFDPALLAAIAADPKLELVLSHELGAGDLPRAAALANPAPAVVQTTVARRQHQRTELLAARAPLADELLALYAAGKRQDAVARQAALQQLDQQLGELEHGLDQALDQLDRDDARARSRRTQTAAIGLGQQRLDHAAAALQRAIPGLSSDRIVRRPPRAIAVAGRPAGGAVVLVARRRSPD